MENNLGFSAVGWVHYRISGGVRQILVISAVYAAILVGLIAFMANMVGERLSGFYSTAAGLLLGLQSFVLLVFGVYRVSAAIRLDMATNMIESHRLMPVRPSHAILGYMIGATTQTWAMAAVNVVVGVALAVAGGINVPEYLMAHGMLGFFALFVWTLTALCALIARGFVGAVSFAPLLFFMTQGALLTLLPALLMLMSPLLGNTIFSTTGRSVTPEHAIGLGAQGALGALFFIAAARKYRRPETPAVLPWMGALILAVWVMLSLIGMGRVTTSAIAREFGDGGPGTQGQLVASMIVSLLLMLPLLCNAGWFAVYARRHRGGVSIHRREAQAVAAMALAVFLGLLLTRGVHAGEQIYQLTETDWMRLGVMGMSLAGFAVGTHYVMRIVYRGKSPRGAGAAVLWLLITWLAPLLVDLVFNAIKQPNDYEVGFATTLSPLGTVGVAFGAWPNNEFQASPVAGAVIQLGVGVAMAVLYFWTEPSGPVQPVRTVEAGSIT